MVRAALRTPEAAPAERSHLTAPLGQPLQAARLSRRTRRTQADRPASGRKHGAVRTRAGAAGRGQAGPGSRAPGTECAGRSSGPAIAVLSHTQWATLWPIDPSSRTEDECPLGDTQPAWPRPPRRAPAPALETVPPGMTRHRDSRGGRRGRAGKGCASLRHDRGPQAPQQICVQLAFCP